MVKSDLAKTLINDFPSTFALQSEQSASSSDSKYFLSLTDELVQSTCEVRTKALEIVTSQLRDRGIIRGWRNELLPLTSSFTSPPMLLLERAACSHFGVRAYGVHINGFVREPKPSSIDGKDGGNGSGVAGRISHIWVATRSKVRVKKLLLLLTNRSILDSTTLRRRAPGRACWTTSWQGPFLSESAWQRMSSRSARRRPASTAPWQPRPFPLVLSLSPFPSLPFSSVFSPLHSYSIPSVHSFSPLSLILLLFCQGRCRTAIWTRKGMSEGTCCSATIWSCRQGLHRHHWTGRWRGLT